MPRFALQVILIHLSNITGLNEEYSKRTMSLLVSDIGTIVMGATAAMSRAPTKVRWLRWSGQQQVCLLPMPPVCLQHTTPHHIHPSAHGLGSHQCNAKQELNMGSICLPARHRHQSPPVLMLLGTHTLMASNTAAAVDSLP
jgi:hypothetical protein